MDKKGSVASKPRILICEDQKEYANELKTQLSAYYDIEHCSDLAKLTSDLERKKSENNLPDILLLDLFWKKDDSISDESRNKVSEYAKEFRNTHIENFKKEVSSALAPHGLMYLDLIRERFSSSVLPIMIYTRGGPYILDEYQIEQIYSKSASFLIKYYDAALKNYLIRRCIERDKCRYDVFLSYASKDRQIAVEVKEKLEVDSKARVFMAEKSISAGEAWTETIRGALASTKIIVVLITPNSLESDWVMAEAGAAWVLRKPVIPATMLVDVSKVPIVVSQFQMRPYETEAQKAALMKEIDSMVVG